MSTNSTKARELRFLLIITGDGMRFFSAPLEHPSVERVKNALIHFRHYTDNRGVEKGARVFVTALDRWLTKSTPNDKGLQTKDTWSNATWDGTFYLDGIDDGPNAIDPSVYVSKEDRDVWMQSDDMWFEAGNADETEPLYEVCVEQDCL